MDQTLLWFPIWSPSFLFSGVLERMIVGGDKSSGEGEGKDEETTLFSSCFLIGFDR